MANGPLRHRTYYEGDDGSILLALKDAGLLPQDLEIVRRDDRRKNPGKDGMVKDVAALVDPVNGAGRSAIAIRDVDELTTDQVRDWFVDRMEAELPSSTAPVQVVSEAGTARILPFRVESTGTPQSGRVIVIAAGLPGGRASTDYGITQFAIDDFVLLLTREQAVYNSVSEFSDVSYDIAFRKLTEIVNLMRANGIPIKHTKRLMHVLRAVTGFRASPATYADRLVKQGVAVLGQAGVRSVFLALIESLEEASRFLTP